MIVESPTTHSNLDDLISLKFHTRIAPADAAKKPIKTTIRASLQVFQYQATWEAHDQVLQLYAQPLHLPASRRGLLQLRESPD